MASIWRPPQWAAPAVVTLSVQPQSNVQTDAQGNVTTTTTARTTYVFDAVLSLEHEQRLEKTLHPVQTGASISSHAYLLPARVSLDIGMSDAMDSYATGHDSVQPPYITAFSGNPSKSVSAYQQMIALQAARVPLTLTTRLRTYQNMLIVSVSPREDNRTIGGLRMRVELEQIFTASVVVAPNSARPNDTENTGVGSINPQSVPTATQSQYGIPKVTSSTTLQQDFTNMWTYVNSTPSGVEVPGAGDYSSSNINSLQQLPSP